MAGFGDTQAAAKDYPPLNFLYSHLHTSIKLELEALAQWVSDLDAHASQAGGAHTSDGLLGKLLKLRERYKFLEQVYKYHSSVEDEVVYPALDGKVKNVTVAYRVEHQDEEMLLEQCSQMISAAISQAGAARRETIRGLTCKVEEIHRTLKKHLSKEEEQLLPLLLHHFSFPEQAALVAQFLYCIPLAMVERVLQWMRPQVPQLEQEQLLQHIRSVVPDELLLQLLTTWLQSTSPTPHPQDPPSTPCTARLGSTPPSTPTTAQAAGTCSRKAPIKEIIHIHRTICCALEEFAKEARNLQQRTDVTAAQLGSLVERHRFLRSVCMFHTISEEEIMYPEVRRLAQTEPVLASPGGAGAHANEACTACEKEHENEVGALEDLGRLLADVRAYARRGRKEVSQMLQQLVITAEQVLASIAKHMAREEAEVFPLLERHLGVGQQRAIVWRTISAMPLRLLERVVPCWAASLSEDDTEELLNNIKLGAPDPDSALLELLTRWADMGRSMAVSKGGSSTLDMLADSFHKQSRGAGSKQPRVAGGAAAGEEDREEVLGDEAAGGHVAKRPRLVRSSSDGGEGGQPQCQKRRTVSPGGRNSPAGTHDQGMGVALQAAVTADGALGGQQHSGPSPRGASPVSASTLMHQESSIAQPAGTGTGDDMRSASPVQAGRVTPAPQAVSHTHRNAFNPIDHIFQFHQALRQELRQLEADALRVERAVLGHLQEEPEGKSSGGQLPCGEGQTQHDTGVLVHTDATPRETTPPIGHGVEDGTERCLTPALSTAHTVQGGMAASGCSGSIDPGNTTNSSFVSRLPKRVGAAVQALDGRFQFLWGIYRAHSRSEDEIVFPALESKQALRNVSHAYTLDHQQEEQLFIDLDQLIDTVRRSKGVGPDVRDAVLAVRRMCAAVRASLETHIRAEESELWPLFTEHFTHEEQQYLVGVIIGRTGAQVLQALLPWISDSFSIEEKEMMMGSLREATKNTMFDQWLEAISLQPPAGSAQHLVDQDATDVSAAADACPAACGLSGAAAGVGAGTVGVAGLRPRLSGHAGHVMEAPPLPDPELARFLTATSTDAHLRDSHAQLAHAQGSPAVTSTDVSETAPFLPDEPGVATTAAGAPSNAAPGAAGAVQQGQQVQSATFESSTFRPGWEDIFRMNQKQLEAAVMRVSADPHLEPGRKAYLIQNIMVSKYIVAQQRRMKQESQQEDDEQGVGVGKEGAGAGQLGAAPSSAAQPEADAQGGAVGEEGRGGKKGWRRMYHDAAQGILGCKHYRRRAALVAPCCNKVFACRLCHDEAVSHRMDRYAVSHMVCMECGTHQPVAESCSMCATKLARYYCNICHLFDDEPDRHIYHCPFCNVCRRGRGLGIDFFHCMACNACMSLSLFNSHTCRERAMESNCPVCSEYLFDSADPIKELPCGHLLHSRCFAEYTRYNYTCPLCSKSVGDMSVYFQMLDSLLASERLPPEYAGRMQQILCNDCGKTGFARFHFAYHACPHCRSYNTRVM